MVNFNGLSRKKLIYLRDLLRELVIRDMKLRYKRSAGGIAWSLLNPLAQLLVLNFVFKLILPLNITNYTVFLLIGLLTWSWFQSSLYSAAGSIVDNRDLIHQPGFPAMILPVATVTTHFIHFLIALPILLIFMMLSDLMLSPSIWTLPLIFLVQYILTLSLAYPLAALQVLFRDVQYLLGIALLFGFYLSPVFYDADLLPIDIQKFYHLNPMSVLLDAYRKILIQDQMPAYDDLGIVLLVSILLLWLGYRVFKLAKKRFSEEL